MATTMWLFMADTLVEVRKPLMRFCSLEREQTASGPRSSRSPWPRIRISVVSGSLVEQEVEA